MSRFVAITAFGGTGRKRKWTIEQTTPGEKPVELDFLGTQKEATDEARRLNMYGHAPADETKKSAHP